MQVESLEQKVCMLRRSHKTIQRAPQARFYELGSMLVLHAELARIPETLTVKEQSRLTGRKVTRQADVVSKAEA